MKIFSVTLSLVAACALSTQAASSLMEGPAASIQGPGLTAWAGAIGKTLTAPGLDAVRQVMDYDLDSGKTLQFLTLPTSGRSILLDEKPQYARRLAQALAAQGLTAETFGKLTSDEQVDALKAAILTTRRTAGDEWSHISSRLSGRVNPTEGETLDLALKAKDMIEFDIPYLRGAYSLDFLHYAVTRGEAVARNRQARIEKFEKELPAKIAAGEFLNGKLTIITDGDRWGVADKSAVPTSDSPTEAVLKRSETLAHVSVGPWSKAMHGALWHAATLEPAKSSIAALEAGLDGLGHYLLMDARLIHDHIDYEGNRSPRKLEARKNVAAALKAGKLPKAADIVSVEKQYLAAIDGAAKHRTLQLNILDWLKNGKSADYPAWPKVLAAKQALGKRLNRATNLSWTAYMVTMFGFPIMHPMSAAATPVTLVVFMAILALTLIPIIYLNTRRDLLKAGALEERMADYEKELAAASEPR